MKLLLFPVRVKKKALLPTHDVAIEELLRLHGFLIQLAAPDARGWGDCRGSDLLPVNRALPFQQSTFHTSAALPIGRLWAVCRQDKKKSVIQHPAYVTNSLPPLVPPTSTRLPWNSFTKQPPNIQQLCPPRTRTRNLFLSPFNTRHVDPQPSGVINLWRWSCSCACSGSPTTSVNK